MKKIIVCIAVILMAVAILAAIVMSGKVAKVLPNAEFSVKIKSERIIDVVEDKTKLPIKNMIGDFIPEEITLTCHAEFTGEEKSSVRLCGVYVNGYEIPHELYENYLDFRGTLVYN